MNNLGMRVVSPSQKVCRGGCRPPPRPPRLSADYNLLAMRNLGMRVVNPSQKDCRGTPPLESGLQPTSDE